jgi:hypothetical protein
MFIPAALGGTEPTSALREAWEVLGNSQARNRMLVILTDGQWWGFQADRLIRAMSESGVITVMALLGGGTEYARGPDGMILRNADGSVTRLPAGARELTEYERHGCKYGAMIDEPLELARLFRRTAESRIREWM